MLKDFKLLCDEIFAEEGIDLGLVDVIGSSIILICEVFMKNVRGVRHIALAKRKQLHQRGIVQIDLEYVASDGSCLVSFTLVEIDIMLLLKHRPCT